MANLGRLMGIALALGLIGCDVKVTDQTPSEYQANHDIGLYEIKARAERETLVSPTSVFLSARVGDQTVELEQNRDGTWTGLASVRCRSSFPLQIRARWTIQGLSARSALVPPQPREIQLIERAPAPEQIGIDTSEKSRKGWEGAVPYRFVTRPMTHITAARIEPVSDDPADVKAAQSISVTSQLPLEASCATPVEVQLLSKATRAHANLVVETDHPTVPTWQTRVDFAPVP